MAEISSSSTATQIGIAIVEQDGCVVVGVREKDVVLGGMHEFPGGKCDSDESPAACAVRETWEETGLQVEIVELINRTTFDYDHGRVELSFFLCRPRDSPPGELAGSFAWVSTAKLGDLNFPAGNREAIQALLAR